MLRAVLLLGWCLVVCGCASEPQTDSRPPTVMAPPAETTTPDIAVPHEQETARLPESAPEPEETLVAEPTTQTELSGADRVVALCQEVGSKLGSVSIDDCLRQRLMGAGETPLRRSLAYKDYESLNPLGRVMLIGGIHGDEFSSVSVAFKWMDILNEHHSGMFYWRIIPLANPDGLLRKKSQRQNNNGVDLNRNFPTRDWDEDARAHWIETTARNPRRHPGNAGASETETQWIVRQIEEFKPDVIISIHAPHHLVDYDGPPTPPHRLGSLNLQPQGVFPGSLGNFAGNDLRLPVLTVELQSAGIMPPRRDIDRMWTDLVQWLQVQLGPARPGKAD